MSSSKQQIRYFKLPAYYENLKCCICLEFFTDPLIISCSHSFCKKCLFNFLKKNISTCPHCREKIKLVGTNIIAEKLLNDLQVMCNNLSCDWLGKRNDLENHLKTCLYNNVDLKEKSVLGKKISATQSQSVDIDEDTIINTKKTINTNLSLHERVLAKKKEELLNKDNKKKRRKNIDKDISISSINDNSNSENNDFGIKQSFEGMYKKNKNKV